MGWEVRKENVGGQGKCMGSRKLAACSCLVGHDWVRKQIQEMALLK